MIIKDLEYEEFNLILGLTGRTEENPIWGK